MKFFNIIPQSQSNEKHRKWLYIVLSFLLPFFILLLCTIALHITPFGQHSLAISDGKYYINGCLSFARLLKGQENVLYTLGAGLGANQWSALAWGSFSFGKLLSYFATIDNMPEVFTWVCLVNISISGLTMYRFCAYLHGHKLSNLIFSTSYALMGFNIAYCYHIGFSVGPQMLPLVCLGIVFICQGKSPILYILSLAFSIITNFYFGFQLCVASVLCYFAYTYIHWMEVKNNYRYTSTSYVISSIIAGTIAAFVWLPAMKAYSGGGRLNQTTFNEFSFSENMPFIQIFTKLFSGAYSLDEMVSGLPNIFCGILTVALVILFFMNKRITKRHKRAAGFLLGFYLISFYIIAFTLAMHGFTHTNWFSFRYSYVFSFILIAIASMEFEYLGEITLRETKRCGAIILVAVILIFSTKYEFISGGVVLLDLALLFLMWIGYYLYKVKPEKAPLRVFSSFLLLVVSVNLYVNAIISINSIKDWELDLASYSSNVMESGAIVEALQSLNDSFFRMEKDVSESEDVGADPTLYNYNGVSHSGPTEREFVHSGLNKLGINWFDMRHWYSEGIPAATDSLLGLKYLISNRDLEKEKKYDLLLTTDSNKIYHNPHALSPAILANAASQDITLENDVFENLNNVWQMMTGESASIFTEQKEVTFTTHNSTSEQSVTSSELRASESTSISDNDDEAIPETNIEFSFIAEESGTVYLFDTSVPASSNGLSIPCIKCYGYYNAGDVVTGNFNVHGLEYITGDLLRGYCSNLVFAFANNDVLEAYAKILNDRDITFNVVHENDLTGTFTADANQRILFTLPWDEGWTCYIDGQETPIDKTWDLFMSVKVPEGQHTYEMKFFPAWMNYGIYISCAALLGLIVFMIAWAVRRRRSPAPTAIAAGEGE